MGDFKYHITSLVSIFLALGIGIFIGSTMVGNDYIVEQQKSMIDRLENDFQALRNKNRFYQNELASANNLTTSYREFSEQVLPLLIQDKLKNFKVSIIKFDANSNINEIGDTLALAGAEVTSITTIMDVIAFDDVNISVAEPGVHGEQVVKSLDESLYQSDKENVISAFLDKQVSKMSDEAGAQVDAVLLIGKGESVVTDQEKWLDKLLLECFLERNIKVIGVELSSEVYSNMKSNQSKPITIIDNIDTVPGKIALVYSLLLGENGHYGFEETANRLLPQLYDR